MNTPIDLPVATTRRRFLSSPGGGLLVAATARGDAVAAAAAVPAKRSEMVVFRHQFTWTEKTPFFCWLLFAPGLGRPGIKGVKTSKEELPYVPFDAGQASYADNWIEPDDYWNGTWQFRFEFKDRPSVMWTDKQKVLHPATHLGEKSGWRDGREEYFPCTIKATVVAVPARRGFSGREQYS